MENISILHLGKIDYDQKLSNFWHLRLSIAAMGMTIIADWITQTYVTKTPAYFINQLLISKWMECTKKNVHITRRLIDTDFQADISHLQKLGSWLDWMKQLLIQNTPEQLQDKHVTKGFIRIENNSTIVLLKLKMSYTLMINSLKLKMSWSLSKKKNSSLQKSRNIITVFQIEV